MDGKYSKNINANYNYVASLEVILNIAIYNKNG
jgi:hypothetical protein